MLSRALAELAMPRLLAARGGFGVALSRGLDMFGPPELELVFRTAGLATIAARANAERPAADATKTKSANRIVDGLTVTEGLRDRRARADSCRA